MNKSMLIPMRLQFFAADTGGGNGGAGATGTGEGDQEENTGTGQSSTNNTPVFDYEKLASIINGKQSVAEDTVLKNYFKQQGLSQEEMNQAIQAFKAEKAKNQPDVTALQSQLAQAQALAEKAEIEKLATIEAIGLGIDAKTLPYVLKMSDLSNVRGTDGKVNQESIKSALNKVLEDVPQLKPTVQGNAGFQIGASGGTNNNQTSDDALKKAFGL